MAGYGQIRRHDLAGKLFGRLVVESWHSTEGAKWNCACDCGNKTAVRASHLRDGHTTSCGCHFREVIKTACKTHGMSRSREAAIWSAMRGRCQNPNNAAYEHYGARGIIVCPEWDNSFEAFLADMGPRPSPAHSIDRIDVNGNYCPENCRWLLTAHQPRNTRKTRFALYLGQTLALAEIHANATTAVAYETFKRRVLRGWDIGEALTAPLCSPAEGGRRSAINRTKKEAARA